MITKDQALSGTTASRSSLTYIYKDYYAAATLFQQLKQHLLLKLLNEIIFSFYN